MYAEGKKPGKAAKVETCKVAIGKAGRKVIRCGRELRNFEHTLRAPDCQSGLRHGCRLHDNVCGGCAALVQYFPAIKSAH